jgi:putative ABC transport system permease protein
MAVRETRSSWRRLLFFFVCIAVGVAAIVALRSVIQNVRAVFGEEARALIAADVLISTNRDWTASALAIIDRRLAEFEASARTETIEMPTMVRLPASAGTATRMVELRAVSEGFPLYGTVGLRDGLIYSHAMLNNQGALVRPELLAALDVEVGDTLIIGDVSFVIRGVITREPGRRVAGFSLGPRVIISSADLSATGLLTFGSRARRVLLVRVSEERVEPLVSALREDLGGEFVRARSYRAADDEIGRDFERAENYLSMIGLVIVILGGIAVSSVIRVFVLQKMRSIAVLKCLGASSGHIMAVYLLQVMALGLSGSALGILLAHAGIAAISVTAGTAAALLADAEYGITASAAAQGVVVGALVSLLFSIAPLLQVRTVKPSLLLREEPLQRVRDWTRVTVVALVSAALVAVAAWQAASLQVGLVICAGFMTLAFALQFVGRGLVRVIRPLAQVRSFPLRHAVLNLSRPGNQTRVILMAVGLGAFFVVGIRSLQGSLFEEFSMELSDDAPDMFLMDIQRDQVDGVRALLEDPEFGVGPFRLIPVVRARVIGVDGRETVLESYEDVRARGSLAREYRVTYREHLEANERIIAGAFWEGPSARGEVSIEEGIGERFEIDIGDTMRFDVLGRVVTAQVTSVREVDWRDSRGGGFMFVFRPGLLDDAPQMNIAPLRGPEDTTRRAAFQHALVDRFPNVSVIDFREILVTIRDVMSRITLAIRVVGGLVVFSGGLILVGAVAMTKFQRVYEAAVFKTLGASTGTIAKMLLLEYGVLGLLAGIVGSTGALALTWGVSRFALEIPWRIFAGEHVAGVVVTAIMVAAVGVIASLDVLRHKPLATLRAD